MYIHVYIYVYIYIYIYTYSCNDSMTLMNGLLLSFDDLYNALKTLMKGSN